MKIDKHLSAKLSHFNVVQFTHKIARKRKRIIPYKLEKVLLVSITFMEGGDHIIVTRMRITLAICFFKHLKIDKTNK